MTRKYVYTNITDEEFKILDTCIEQLGFVSRTDYFTASAHVLIYGRNPFEWNSNLNNIQQKNELMKKTFFDTVQEKAFPIIAMNGTGALISSGIIEDVKLELLNKCGMIPEDYELRDYSQTFGLLGLGRRFQRLPAVQDLQKSPSRRPRCLQSKNNNTENGGKR